MNKKHAFVSTALLRAALLVLLSASLQAQTGVARADALSVGDDSVFTNSIGMQFLRVRAGSTIIGRFQPTCPTKPAAGTIAGAPPASTGGVNDVPTAAGSPVARATVASTMPMPGGRGGARAPVDPRARWTDADYAFCADLAKRDALPGFTVNIDRAFYLGKYEVTQSQFDAVMKRNPSVFNSAKLGRDARENPVDNVTWEDAQTFVDKLNRREKSSHYRLPTEFEWEYAARASRSGEPGWPEVRASAWIQDADKGSTHSVGTKEANGWGFHDMLGNVWEWMSDGYNERLFADPSSAIKHKLRDPRTHVLKGGSFVSDVKNATWSTHAGGPGSGFDVGFRIVRESRE